MDCDGKYHGGESEILAVKATRAVTASAATPQFHISRASRHNVIYYTSRKTAWNYNR